MNAENDNFNTPKQTKRLGLRRTSSVLKYNSIEKKPTEFAEKCKAAEIITTGSMHRRRLPQSDVKINYKHLEQIDHNNVTTPDTPKNTSSLELQRLAVSTNCRPYRLALSKKMREKMTKKRLEFYMANEMEKQEAFELMKTEELQKKYETEKSLFNSSEDLLMQIEDARKELISRQEHLNKVQELQQAIAVWKTGFNSALHDLQQKIEPRLETAVLLESLRIPQEMIKYIND